MARITRCAQLGLAFGAILTYASAHLHWIAVTAADDKSGTREVMVSGSLFSPVMQVLPWVFLAASVASFALRALSRRVIGGFAALIAVAASWVPLQTLSGPIDDDRLLQVLTSSSSVGTADQGALLQSWADITATQVQPLGIAVGIVAMAVVLVSGIILALRPGTDTVSSNKYETQGSRQAKLAEDLREDPDSGRVLWDALDADIDPTEQGNQDTKDSYPEQQSR